MFFFFFANNITRLSLKLSPRRQRPSPGRDVLLFFFFVIQLYLDGKNPIIDHAYSADQTRPICRRPTFRGYVSPTTGWHDHYDMRNFQPFTYVVIDTLCYYAAN